MILGNFDQNDVFNSSMFDSFEFDDGSTLTTTELLARGFDIDGTANNDYIVGTNTTDRINGLAGDDTVYGMDGNDTLNGLNNDITSENLSVLTGVETAAAKDNRSRRERNDVWFVREKRESANDETTYAWRIAA